MARVAKLDVAIATATEELEQLQAKAGKIHQAIQELEKKILEVGGSKLLTQKSKVDGLKLHISLANDEITKAEVAKAKAEKDVTKLESAIETNTAVLEEVEAELETLNGQLAELEQYVSELRAKVDAAQVAADEQKGDLESRKAELDEREETIQEFRKKEVRIAILPGEPTEMFNRPRSNKAWLTRKKSTRKTRKNLSTGEPNTIGLRWKK